MWTAHVLGCVITMGLIFMPKSSNLNMNLMIHKLQPKTKPDIQLWHKKRTVSQQTKTTAPKTDRRPTMAHETVSYDARMSVRMISLITRQYHDILNAKLDKFNNNTNCDTRQQNLEQKVNQMTKSFNDTRDRVDTYFNIMQSSADSRINGISQKQWQMEQVLNNINRMVVSLYEAHQNKTQ